MRVLAISSSRVGNSAYLESAVPMINDFLGSAPLNIAFIPFALVNNDYQHYLSMVQEGLRSLPHAITVVEPGNAKATIEACDAIMVGGGNTFKLLHDIYAYDLYELIKQKVLEGTPYIGWSAGANISGASLKTTNDMPIIEPKSFSAFNFFPFQLNPHYINVKQEGHNGETRDQRLEEFVTLNPGVPVVGIPEGTALVQENGSIKMIGIAEGVQFVNKQDGFPFKYTIAAGQDLSYLLQ